MILRAAKTLLVLAVALYYTLLVLNNTTDYDSNFQFIRHVLMMDSTFPNNSGDVARHQLAGDSHVCSTSRSSRGNRSL